MTLSFTTVHSAFELDDSKFVIVVQRDVGSVLAGAMVVVSGSEVLAIVESGAVLVLLAVVDVDGLDVVGVDVVGVDVVEGFSACSIVAGD